jgi:hypothetical protein
MLPVSRLFNLAWSRTIIITRSRQSSRQSPSLQALTTCSTSALDSLRIVSQDFAKMSMLVCYISVYNDLLTLMLDP